MSAFFLFYMTLVNGTLNVTKMGEFESFEHCMVALHEYEIKISSLHQDLTCMENGNG